MPEDIIQIEAPQILGAMNILDMMGIWGAQPPQPPVAQARFEREEVVDLPFQLNELGGFGDVDEDMPRLMDQVVDDDDDDDGGEDEEEWGAYAAAMIREGDYRSINPAPGDHQYELNVDGSTYLWQNRFGLMDINGDFLLDIREHQPARGRVVMNDGDRHIPPGVNPAPPQEPRMFQPRLRPMGGQKVKKAKFYPPEGYMYKGFQFSRELDDTERYYLATVGYHETLKRYPELVYSPKEMPVDDSEECVILLSELADHLTMQACKTHIVDFSLEEHADEYQAVYKRYLKEISAFKRTKNG